MIWIVYFTRADIFGIHEKIWLSCGRDRKPPDQKGKKNASWAPRSLPRKLFLQASWFREENEGSKKERNNSLKVREKGEDKREDG